jgi:transposase-like protein
MTMPSLIERVHDDGMGECLQPERPRRRRFSAEYKLAILADYDRLSVAGEKGALLRREGLYSSHIVEWRRAREAGLLGSGSTPAKTTSEQSAALAKANRRAERAEAELAKTKVALEIMGKAHALLELLAESADCDPKSTK